MPKRGAPDPNRDNEIDPYGPASSRYVWADSLDEELDRRDREAAARFTPEAA